MLIRLVLAVKNKDIRNTLEKHFSQTDVRMESFGHLKTAWQKVVEAARILL